MLRALKKQSKKWLALIGVLLLAVSCCFGAAASVFVPYSTYTYDYDGDYLESPHAYVPEVRLTSTDMGIPPSGDKTPLMDAGDMVVGPEGNIYIADTASNRVLVLSPEMKMLGSLSYFYNEGSIQEYLDALVAGEITGKTIPEEYLEDPWAYYEDVLSGGPEDPSVNTLNVPEGIFVTADGHLYVADTGNKRVLEFKQSAEGDYENWDLVREIKNLESDVLSEDFIFQPGDLVVDSAGRIYVNVKNVNSGIVELSVEGEFVSFYGAQKVQQSVVDWFLRLFMTDEQKARTVNIIPRQYNNISIDSKNFIWLTANSMDTFEQFSYLESGDSAAAPIKRLNPNGDDVLARQGVWAPGGDIIDATTVSSIVDVAIKDNGTYTMLDDKRNKLFTYDANGNLLYAFGGTGSQLGVFQLVGSIIYYGDDLLVLDKGAGTVTRFVMTDYARLIEEAIDADNNSEFEKSMECWQAVHKRNANLDLAYVGMAKSYLRNARTAEDPLAAYQTAMDYYERARNTEGYSQAFKEYRSLYVRENIVLVLAVPVVIGVLIYLATRAMKKVNAKIHVSGEATTLPQELIYGWRTIFHPLNGFWEIKREKRGSFRAATIFLIATVVAFCYNATGTAYLFRTANVEDISLLQQAANVLIPVVLWVLASWALTTLMSGEGSMKDIYIALGYALIPMILLVIPATLLSNVLTLDEQAFFTFFLTLSYLWAGLLIIFGSMVIQDYTFGKNLLTVILSVVGMAVILFLVLLLITLTQKIVGFFGGLYEEIVFRL